MTARTADAILIRRCQNHPGYEFISPTGQPDPRRMATVDGLVTLLYERSANSTHEAAFGGSIRYVSASAAQTALHEGQAKSGVHFSREQMSQDRADRILKKIVSQTTKAKHSEEADRDAFSAIDRLIKDASKQVYKSRGRLASGSLHKRDVASAQGHLEALIEHAERSGSTRDAQLATQALLIIRDSYPEEAAAPIPTDERYTLRKIDDGYQLYDGGKPYGEPFSARRDADSRRRFLNRTARKRAGADEIDAQERGEPVVRRVNRDESEEEAA
jgi:hypothetical protein